jgi:hypothetical protein
MSRYGRGGDDGTFWMGLGAAGLAIIAFCAGYTLRDSGYVLGATQTNTLLPIQHPPLNTKSTAPKEVQTQ